MTFEDLEGCGPKPEPIWETEINKRDWPLWYGVAAEALAEDMVRQYLRHNKWYRRLWRWCVRQWRGACAWWVQKETEQ